MCNKFRKTVLIGASRISTKYYKIMAISSLFSVDMRNKLHMANQKEHHAWNQKGMYLILLFRLLLQSSACYLERQPQLKLWGLD